MTQGTPSPQDLELIVYGNESNPKIAEQQLYELLGRFAVASDRRQTEEIEVIELQMDTLITAHPELLVKAFEKDLDNN